MSGSRRLKNLPFDAPLLTERLKGHSGCRLDLIHRNDGLRVRKTSKDFNYNSRLQKQFEKQRAFKTEAGVRAPRVLSTGFDKGLFFFEMDYIHGQTLANWLDNSLNFNLTATTQQLGNLLRTRKSVVHAQAPKIFASKILSLRQSLASTPTMQQAFVKLDSFDWSKSISSPCHGDLTFENILVSREGSLYLVDFLDSFFDSWIIDLAKLLQDLELRWSFRDSPANGHRNLRLAILRESLLQSILARADGPSILKSAYHMLLLNVLRIIPYSQPSGLPFLETALSHTMNRIAEIEAQFQEDSP